MTKLVLIFASVLALTIASMANAQEPTGAEGAATAEKPAAKKPAAKKAAAKKHDEKKDAVASATKEELPKDVKKLIVQDMIQGTGKGASKGKAVKVNYTGWLYDPSASMGRGKQFDSSVGKEPFTFTLGEGKVIKGWEDGFVDMKVGGKRKLIVPGSMAYPNGAGSVIPPNATLMFEVELIDVM
jgi:FKBP-type peptidyl-prolyl cis-trans isomerase FkpA